MPPAETIQKLAFEGPLTLRQLIGLGLGLLILIGILSFREYKSAGSVKLLAFLLPIRMIAVALVLWMIGGATLTTFLRESRPKSVVILADSSASMSIVDPVDGSGNTTMWSLAQPSEQSDSNLRAVTTVAGQLRSATSSLRRIGQLSLETEAREQSSALWAEAHETIASAFATLNRCHLDKAEKDAQLRTEMSQAETFFKSSRKLAPAAQAEQLEETAALVETVSRRVDRLAQQLATENEQSPSAHEQAVLVNQSKLSRRDKVTAWLEASESLWVKDLEAKARVLRYSFAAKPLPVTEHAWRQVLDVSPTDLGNTTDISAALDRAMQDAAQQSAEAVLMITDGGHNTSSDPRVAAAALKGVPLYLVPIGDPTMPRDVILHHAHCPRSVFKNDNAIFDAIVTAYDCEGEQLEAELLNGSQVIDTKKLAVTGKVFDSRLSFEWKATAYGRQQLKIRVKPVSREHSIENNEAQSEIEVLEDTIRVLVADARPRWEFRYLINLFKRDKHIDFEQLLFDPKDDSQAGGPSLPRDMDAWRRYRVIILGDLTPEQLNSSQQELLKKFVTEESGNLIVIAGETAMPAAFSEQPLASMLPIISSASPINREQGCSLAVTAEGGQCVATQLEDDPVASERLWREMSGKVPIYLPAIARPKPTGHVLISAISGPSAGDSEAFLSWQYVGLGRVIYIGAPVTYQLRYQIGDEYHHRFWGQLLRWATAREMTGGSKTVRISTDKPGYEKGDTAEVALNLRHVDGRTVASGECKVEAMRDKQVVKIVELREDSKAPGTYRGTLDDLPLGPLTLRAGGSTVGSLLAEENYKGAVEQVVAVDPRLSTELSSPVCNLPLLQQLADASGGAVLSPASVPAALARINAVPDIQQSIVSRQPIWNRWRYLWIFVGCLTLEWLTRKYWRMT